MTPQERQERGERARRLLDDPLIAEALDGLEQSYTLAWKRSDLLEAEGRERLWQAIQILGHVRQHLVLVASDGELAKAEVESMTRNAR